MKKIYLGVIGLVSVVFLFVWCNDSGIQKGDGEAVDFIYSFITTTPDNGGGVDNGGGNNTGGGVNNTPTCGSWSVTTLATCTDLGVQTRTCTKDGSSYTETINTAMLTGAACYYGGAPNNCVSASSCKTKKMPDGKIWMTENLNIQTEGSWCYGEDGVVRVGDDARTLSSAEIQANCNKYGRLYSWEAAMTACPSGWRLPDTADWNRLVEAAGGYYNAGKQLKSTSGWDNKDDGSNGNGTDEYEFSALPGGQGGGNPGNPFYYAGNYGIWWTATANGRGYFRSMSNNYYTVYESRSDTYAGHSVRCVKDN
jgi:uncharacterized protein (TIGR02145 family)